MKFDFEWSEKFDMVFTSMTVQDERIGDEDFLNL